MKALTFIGITALAYLFFEGFISVPFLDVAITVFNEYANWILIAIGVFQSLSVLLMIYKTGVLKTIGETTILISSLILLANSEILFVVCNLMLLFSSKFYLPQSAKTAVKKTSEPKPSLRQFDYLTSQQICNF